MIQWEPDFVSEEDSSVIVRCERPDNYNKTISWNLASGDLKATVEKSTHPGKCSLHAFLLKLNANEFDGRQETKYSMRKSVLNVKSHL